MTKRATAANGRQQMNIPGSAAAELQEWIKEKEAEIGFKVTQAAAVSHLIKFYREQKRGKTA